MICLLVCSCVFSSFCFDWDDLKKWGNVRESDGCDWSVKVQNLCLHSADNGEKSLPLKCQTKQFVDVVLKYWVWNIKMMELNGQ